MGCQNCKVRYGSEKVEYVCTLTEFSPELTDDRGHCRTNGIKSLSEFCSGYDSDDFCPGCGKYLDTEICQCPSNVQWS